jgi:hypothetical protein
VLESSSSAWRGFVGLLFRLRWDGAVGRAGLGYELANGRYRSVGVMKELIGLLSDVCRFGRRGRMRLLLGRDVGVDGEPEVTGFEMMWSELGVEGEILQIEEYTTRSVRNLVTRSDWVVGTDLSLAKKRNLRDEVLDRRLYALVRSE